MSKKPISVEFLEGGSFGGYVSLSVDNDRVDLFNWIGWAFNARDRVTEPYRWVGPTSNKRNRRLKEDHHRNREVQGHDEVTFRFNLVEFGESFLYHYDPKELSRYLADFVDPTFQANSFLDAVSNFEELFSTAFVVPITRFGRHERLRARLHPGSADIDILEEKVRVYSSPLPKDPTMPELRYPIAIQKRFSVEDPHTSYFHYDEFPRDYRRSLGEKRLSFLQSDPRIVLLQVCSGLPELDDVPEFGDMRHYSPIMSPEEKREVFYYIGWKWTRIDYTADFVSSVSQKQRSDYKMRGIEAEKAF